MKAAINKILTITTLFLAVGVNVSCTQFCARFVDMGQISTGIGITEPKEVYRVDNRLYKRPNLSTDTIGFGKSSKLTAVNTRVFRALRPEVCTTKFHRVLTARLNAIT